MDICDVYLFRGTAGTVMVLTVGPLSAPGGFEPDGLYEFNVRRTRPVRQRRLRGRHRSGVVTDVVFRVSFGPALPGGLQPLQLQFITGEGGWDGDAAGVVVGSGHTETMIEGDHGIRIWAGQAADPFYIHPQVVTAVAQAVQAGAALDVRNLLATDPVNLFAGHNVNAIVVEVPDKIMSGRIGLWGTTRRQHNHAWHQVQRCATPLIPTIFFPSDGDLASRYNTTEPAQDLENYGPLIAELAGRIAAQLGSAEDAQAHGLRVRDELLPDILWYQVGTAAQFGFTGRNGRGLTDPVAEVMFALVTGRAIPLGLDKHSATGALRSGFPYLSEPIGRSPAPGLARPST